MDVSEAQTCVTVYGGDRPLILQAVTTILGYHEVARGIFSLLKSCLTFFEGVAPSHRHFQCISPLLYPGVLEHGTVIIPLEPVVLPSTFMTAQTNMGYGGTNTHIILQAKRRVAKFFAAKQLILSAKSLTSLRELVKTHLDILKCYNGRLDSFCSTPRQRFSSILAVSGHNPAQLVQGLLKFQDFGLAADRLLGVPYAGIRTLAKVSLACGGQTGCQSFLERVKLCWKLCAEIASMVNLWRFYGFGPMGNLSLGLLFGLTLTEVAFFHLAKTEPLLLCQLVSARSPPRLASLKSLDSLICRGVRYVAHWLHHPNVPSSKEVSPVCIFAAAVTSPDEFVLQVGRSTVLRGIFRSSYLCTISKTAPQQAIDCAAMISPKERSDGGARDRPTYQFDRKVTYVPQ